MLRYVLLVVLGLACLGCSKENQASVPNKVEKKTWTRDEFRSTILGKTANEVIELVGKPDSTQESGNTHYWYYEGIKDVITEKAGRAQVVFDNGRVERVNY